MLPAASVAFTVPETHYAIVKMIGAQHVGGATQHLSLFISPPGLATAVATINVPANSGALVPVFLVFNPGEQVFWTSDTAVASLVAALHGYRVLATS